MAVYPDLQQRAIAELRHRLQLAQRRIAELEYAPPGYGPPETTESQSLREALDKEGLRLARCGEVTPLRFCLECKVCGEVTEIQSFMAMPAGCYQCGGSRQTAAMIFHVLLPKSVPLPEEAP